jgi:hypothetical protein
MNFIKGVAHLLLIWLAIVFTLAGAAFLMASCDLMGDLGRSTHTHYSKDAT